MAVMGSVRRTWLSAAAAAVVLLLVALSAGGVAPAAAERYIVLDADGSVEGYAALATVLQSPDFSSRLRLVTVSGTTWGYGASAVRGLCRFVSLAGASSSVTVALGQVAAQEDAYRPEAHVGGCAASQGFPATPHDAALRAMPYSRADETSAYGKVAALPQLPAGGSASSCREAIGSASGVFLSLLRQADADRDTIVYVQLGSATNLAAMQAAVQSQGNPSLLSKFYTVMEVHALETGFSGGADALAMSQVLAPYNEYRLPVRLYPPAFFKPSASFTASSWAAFRTVADASATSPTVSWLYSAWAAKRAAVDAAAGDDVAFFREDSAASSLVVMCALDDTIKELCRLYRTAAVAISAVAVYEPTPSAPSESVIAVSGANVTVPFYYIVGGGAPAAASSYTYTTPASTTIPGNAQSVAEVFWTRWLFVLHR